MFRLKHGIPVHGADYDREMLLNLNDLSYVSFEKGCFLGQEIIARVHHRGKPPKKLVVRRERDAKHQAGANERGSQHGLLPSSPQ